MPKAIGCGFVASSPRRGHADRSGNADQHFFNTLYYSRRLQNNLLCTSFGIFICASVFYVSVVKTICVKDRGGVWMWMVVNKCIHEYTNNHTLDTLSKTRGCNRPFSHAPFIHTYDATTSQDSTRTQHGDWGYTNLEGESHLILFHTMRRDSMDHRVCSRDADPLRRIRRIRCTGTCVWDRGRRDEWRALQKDSRGDEEDERPDASGVYSYFNFNQTWTNVLGYSPYHYRRSIQKPFSK
jgi:hypothetical protein